MIIDSRPKRQAKKQVPHSIRKGIAAAIDEIEDPAARRAFIETVAEANGVGASTVYDWWKRERDGTLQARAANEIDAELLRQIMVIFYAHKGDATATYKECKEAGLWTKSVRQFQRDLCQHVDRMIRLAAKCDEEAASLLGRYAWYTVPHRDYEWQIDLVDLCVQVDLGSGPTAHAWAVVVVDKRQGVTRGWALSAGVPTADVVVKALVMGIRGRTELLVRADGTTEEVVLRGAPKVLRPDNGLQLLAEIVVLLMAEARCVVMATDEYRATAKACIERYNREFKRFSLDVFGTTRAPKTLRGLEIFRDPSLVLTAAELEPLVGELVHDHDRAVQRGEKKCPLELYADDSYQGVTIAEDVLAKFQMKQLPKPFAIHRGAVRYRTKRWTADEIEDLRGNSVELWVSEIDPDYVEGRAEGRRFQLSCDLSEDDVEDILESRSDKMAEINELRGVAAAHNKATTAQRVEDARTTGDDDAPSEIEDGVVDSDDDLLRSLDQRMREGGESE